MLYSFRQNYNALFVIRTGLFANIILEFTIYININHKNALFYLMNKNFRPHTEGFNNKALS